MLDTTNTQELDNPTSDLEIVRRYLDQVKPPDALSKSESSKLEAQLRELMLTKNARLVAHYYSDSSLQDLADDTGGFVGDSLEMARFGRESNADILVVAGVRFMGESAKILSPNKKVLMPTLEATCSLDIACPIETFAPFCDEHPDRTVVVYANTSAAVKARSDWIVTSSIALDVVEYLSGEGQKILWAPDKHLGAYIKKTTDADILLWDAACIVHEEFKARGIKDMLGIYPDAAVLAHPESTDAVLELADVIGSTTQIINAAKRLPNRDIIVATDQGIFHKLQQQNPDKSFIIAPTAGNSATCRSCAHCPWMAMNSFQSMYSSLLQETNEVLVESTLAEQAMKPLQRMLDFAAKNQLRVRGRV